MGGRFCSRDQDALGMRHVVEILPPIEEKFKAFFFQFGFGTQARRRPKIKKRFLQQLGRDFVFEFE